MPVKTFSYSGGEIQVNTDSREIAIITHPIFGSSKTTIIPFGDLKDFGRDFGLLDGMNSGPRTLTIETKSSYKFKLAFASGDDCKECFSFVYGAL